MISCPIGTYLLIQLFLPCSDIVDLRDIQKDMAHLVGDQGQDIDAIGKTQ